MTAVNYLWDPVEHNIVRELDDTGAVIAQYTTEPGLYGDLLSQRRNGQDSCYHYDGQGSTLALTNANGDVTDTYAYSAFGEVTEHTGSTVNPFQYIGQQQYHRDSETGELDVRRRLLFVLFGRWLAADPFKATGRAHLYIYCTNRATRLIDPSGLDEESGNANWIGYGKLEWSDFQGPIPLEGHFGPEDAATDSQIEFIPGASRKPLVTSSKYRTAGDCHKMARNVANVGFKHHPYSWPKDVESFIDQTEGGCWLGAAMAKAVFYQAVFYRDRSWVDEKDDKLLEHEQRHFDITNVYARYLNTYVLTVRGCACSTTKNRAESLAHNMWVGWINKFESMIRALLITEQARYDVQTRHGVDPDQQAIWNSKIDNAGNWPGEGGHIGPMWVSSE